MTTKAAPDGDDDSGGGYGGGMDEGSAGRFTLGGGPQGGRVLVGRATPVQVPVKNTALKSKQFGTLYHGSPNANIKKGDVIKPASSFGGKSTKVANASTSIYVGSLFAGDAGKVYLVKPLNRIETVITTKRAAKPYNGHMPYVGHKVSKKGFKVVGEVPKNTNYPLDIDGWGIYNPLRLEGQKNKTAAQIAHERDMA